ncbi:MAG: ATP-binding cassette domain-containing protein [Bacillota bacterium]
MIVVQMDGVSKSYGTKPVITEASFQIRAGERLGLVGQNGAGKTTLLRLIAGLETPDSGQNSIPKDTLISYAEQDPSFESDLSIVEATIKHLNAELADLELYLYPDRMAEKARSLALAEKMLEECYKKWESSANGT